CCRNSLWVGKRPILHSTLRHLAIHAILVDTTPRHTLMRGECMQTRTAPSPFEGTWDVTHATLPNGEFAYSGRISVQQNAATFQLTWDITAGRYVGVGLVHDDHLFVSCGEQFAGLGIALYTHHPESTPTIQWSTAELAGSVGTGMFT